MYTEIGIRSTIVIILIVYSQAAAAAAEIQVLDKVCVMTLPIHTPVNIQCSAVYGHMNRLFIYFHFNSMTDKTELSLCSKIYN